MENKTLKTKKISILGIIFLSFMTLNLLIAGLLLVFYKAREANIPKDMRAKNYIYATLLIEDITFNEVFTTITANNLENEANNPKEYNIYLCNDILESSGFYYDIQGGAAIEVLYYEIDTDYMYKNPTISIFFNGKEYLNQEVGIGGVIDYVGFMDEDGFKYLAYYSSLYFFFPLSGVFLLLAIIAIAKKAQKNKVKH